MKILRNSFSNTIRSRIAKCIILNLLNNFGGLVKKYGKRFAALFVKQPYQAESLITPSDNSFKGKLYVMTGPNTLFCSRTSCKYTQNLWKRRIKGTNVFVMPVNKAFAKTNEDRRKNRGNVKESGFMKKNGLQIITRRMVIFNTPCCIWQLVAQVGISRSNSLSNNFANKNEYGKKHIQGSVLRERQQGEKRYCPHHGTSDNQRDCGAVQL